MDALLGLPLGVIPNLDDYLWNTQTEVCGYTFKNKGCSRKLQLAFFHNRSSGFGITGLSGELLFGHLQAIARQVQLQDEAVMNEAVDGRRFF